MIRSLLWKEFREHLPKFLIILAVYLVIVLTTRLAIGPQGLEFANSTLWFALLVVPGFLAMGTLTEENPGRARQGRGTLETLRALPLSLGAIFWTKTLAALLTAIIPLLIIEPFTRFLLFPEAAAKYDPWWPESAYRNWPRDFLMMIGLCISLYLWTLAVAARSKSELSVALKYAALLAACALLEILSSQSYYIFNYTTHKFEFEFHWFWSSLRGATPLGFLHFATRLFDGSIVALNTSNVIVKQLILLAPILWLARRRFATDSIPSTRALRKSAAATPFRTWPPRFPVLWKTWREIRLLVLGTAAFTSLAWIIDVAAVVIRDASSQLNRSSPSVVQLLFSVAGYDIESMFRLSLFLAFFVAIVLGSEIAMRDHEGGIDLFWLARPIRQQTYFAKRFFFGASLSFLVTSIPAILFALAFLLVSTLFLKRPVTREEVILYQNQHTYLYPLFRTIDIGKWHTFAIFLRYAPLATLAFSLSAFFATLNRRRIISMTLATGCILFIWIFIPSANDDSGHLFTLLQYGNGISFQTQSYLISITLSALACLTATLTLAFLCTLSLRNHWKQRLESINLLPAKSISNAALRA